MSKETDLVPECTPDDVDRIVREARAMRAETIAYGLRTSLRYMRDKLRTGKEAIAPTTGHSPFGRFWLKTFRRRPATL